MPQVTRHQIGAAVLAALRAAGLGVRDLFEGRQEPVTWYFRCLAYDQSELDIMESGAIDTLHAPSALVELSLDEVALAGLALGPEGIASYLEGDGIPDAETLFDAAAGTEPPVDFHADVLLGTLTVDSAPPGLWLDEQPADPEANERLARRLAVMAQELGRDADSVEVHIEGSLDASEEGWADEAVRVRPAGVSVRFAFDLPLIEADERTLGQAFEAGARAAALSLEAMRKVFERLG